MMRLLFAAALAFGATTAGAADTWLGYSGSSAGGGAMVAYSMATRATVAVALTGEGSPEALARGLLSQLRPA